MVDLAGTWRFTAVQGADVKAGLRSPPFLTFDGDGQVYGDAGVNRVRGTWELAGTRLVFGPMVSTMMAGPPEAMTCEQRILRLLGDPVELVAPDGDTIELDGSGGAATLVRDESAGHRPV
jgi:heat shock protein HslJ